MFVWTATEKWSELIAQHPSTFDNAFQINPFPLQCTLKEVRCVQAKFTNFMTNTKIQLHFPMMENL